MNNFKYQVGDIMFDKIFKIWYLVLEISCGKGLEPPIYKLLSLETGKQLQSLIPPVDNNIHIILEA